MADKKSSAKKSNDKKMVQIAKGKKMPKDKVDRLKKEGYTMLGDYPNVSPKNTQSSSQTKRKRTNSETKEQEILFDTLAQLYPSIFQATFAIVNEGKMPVQYRTKLKKRGLKPGVWDIFCAIPKRGFCGLWLELKVGYNKLTDNQQSWQAIIDNNGYAWAVCYGWQEAFSRLLDYMEYDNDLRGQISIRGYANFES